MWGNKKRTKAMNTRAMNTLLHRNLSRYIHLTFLLTFVLNIYLLLPSPIQSPEETIATASELDTLRIDDLDLDDPSAYLVEPFQNLNIFNATVVYHIGWDSHMGQTNNQLVAILHALDMAFDANGELAWDGSNCNAILAISGWATKILGLFLSDNPGVDFGWTNHLPKNLPIVQYEQLTTLHLPATIEVVKLGVGEAYYYPTTILDTLSPPRLKRRRKLFLRKLLSMIPRIQLQRYHWLMHYLDKEGLGEKYVALHIRSLDGECKKRVGRQLSHDECDMGPDYIKRLLRPHYTNLSKVPIVVISDMHRERPVRRLLADPEIGRNVIVAAMKFPIQIFPNTAVIQDMMISAKSDFFIGPRVSTMTVMIGLMRAALGAHPRTNLVYVRESRPFFFKNHLEVCGDCIFYCDREANNICGEKSIYA